MPDHLIGVISDTHGLLRPEAVEALKGVELIIHAGDIGNPQLLAALTRIAPVQAVRGNTDRGDWAADLPHTRVVEVGGVHLYVLHELFTLDLDPAAAHAIMALLRRLAQAGATVIVVLHALDLARDYADRMVVLQDGRIIADAAPADALPAAARAFGLPVGLDTQPRLLPPAAA